MEHPEFELAAGMTALRAVASGWGYDITGADVLPMKSFVRSQTASPNTARSSTSCCRTQSGICRATKVQKAFV